MERQKPTSRKRTKAEQAGLKAAFPFFRSSLLLLLGLEIFLWRLPMMKNDLMETLGSLWAPGEMPSGGMAEVFQRMGIEILSILGPGLLFFYFALLIVNGLFKAFRTPKRSSLFGYSPSLYRALLPIGGFLALLILTVSMTWITLIQTIAAPLDQSQGLMVDSLSWTLHLMAGTVFLLGWLDYYLGKRAFEKSLSMTKEEIEEEMREECGNPGVKSAQREEWQRTPVK